MTAGHHHHHLGTTKGEASQADPTHPSHSLYYTKQGEAR